MQQQIARRGQAWAPKASTQDSWPSGTRLPTERTRAAISAQHSRTVARLRASDLTVATRKKALRVIGALTGWGRMGMVRTRSGKVMESLELGGLGAVHPEGKAEFVGRIGADRDEEFLLDLVQVLARDLQGRHMRRGAQIGRDFFG